MTAGALHSDHINYLILRYLQEHGHENAATAFYRDWHRPQEFRDPETLPFAPVVKRHALVSVVQDGLLYDELSAKHSRYGRRFPWTAINPREPLEEQDVAALENGAGGAAMGSSRPSSSGKRQGRGRTQPPPPAMRAPDEFPTPAAKRQRRSEGSEGVHLNGDRDAMDVDAITPSAEEADEDAEVASPNVASDTDAIEVPERYDSMDVATQTDVKTGPKTSTMYWKIDKPGARILHSIWNPDSDPKNAKTLLTVGESLCRFYEVPEEMDDVKQITCLDDAHVPPNSVVTATAWHPAGHTAAYALDSSHGLADGTHGPSQLIFNHSRDYGTTVFETGPDLLHPAPIVLCLRYSPKGDYLLVLRTNVKRGMVQIWRTPAAEHQDDGSAPPFRPNEPVAWRILEHPALDACWTADDRFLVCGDEGLASAYHLDPTAKPDNGFVAENVTIHGLREHRSDMLGFNARWDKLRFDSKLGVAVFASTEGKKLLALPLHIDSSAGADGKPNPDDALSLPGQLTALAFQPGQAVTAEEDEGAPQVCLLAAAFAEGHCTIYRLSRPTSDTRPTCKEIVTLELAEGPALALAWSPGGEYLAVGGVDVVQIWRREDLPAEAEAEAGTEGRKVGALVTWRPDGKARALGRRNGVHEHEHEHAEEDGNENESGDEEGMVEPSLSWSADGGSLAFAAEKQLAVIRFRPPLHADDSAEEDADADADVDADADAEGSVE
ncbi:hypothetical protein LTR36_010788 [Oleoguttula mirabilis]|uniref:LisH domain-containing protein n=1 Tax=Oleoguttula mirabilis TaxID=1507867 RepID=A0AAV9JRD4_9PEZI|nr:hypothetical protein LTR36_010788 [Oleoguttula mirabilis]